MRGYQAAIDVERTEIVHQHGEPPSRRLAQQAIEQRRLACSQEATDDSEGNHAFGASNTLPPSTVPQTPDVLELLRSDLQRIVFEDGEVGALADIDAAQLLVELERVGGPERDRPQSIGNGDLLRLARVRPEAVSRLTAHQAVNSGPIGVTGASQWMANGTPVAKAVPQASIRSARSGPSVLA
jgi:hypothetical protein